MSTVSNITGTTNANSNTASGTTQLPEQTLGQDDFLKLLTVQLSSQDPLKPMDDTAFISQMASFSSLQEMQALNQTFNSYASDEKLAQAASYIGKNVSVTDSLNATQSGVVSGIDASSGTPQIVVNGQPYDFSRIQTVSNP